MCKTTLLLINLDTFMSSDSFFDFDSKLKIAYFIPNINRSIKYNRIIIDLKKYCYIILNKTSISLHIIK